ncbi:MAG: cyclopropane-fatty-acyl-phospholipid synthase family protein [Planctomycetaceae bacterium]
MSIAPAIDNLSAPTAPASDESSADRFACNRTTGLIDRLTRRTVLDRLSCMCNGRIILRDGCDDFICGSTSPDGLSSDLTVHSASFYRRLVTGGSLGFAESYLQGEWDSEDLPALLRIFCRNLNRVHSVSGGFASFAKALARAGHWLSRNTRSGSRRNIEAHYDLGNDFFELFLDPTMMYSSAIFDDPTMTLEDAQTARLDRICQRLDLKPTDHLMEIGTGWGGLAIHAARNYGCRVTTTTISEQQYQYAERQVRELGLRNQITLRRQDYRDLEGQFDKLVSIEMIEAVGPQYYDTFFRKCASLLKPNGCMLVQAIVMPEQRYATYLKSVDFIQKYIFPGGSLPSISVMQQAASRTSSLRLVELNDFAAGYAQTLRAWRAEFRNRLDEVRALGYPERFIRMWDYYLCYCEAAFEERAVGVVHAVWNRQLLSSDGH